MVKLSKECKALRLEWIVAVSAFALEAGEDARASLAMSDTGFTVLFVPGESVDYIATAVASDEDQPANRKVGEFYALQRYMDGAAVPVPKGTFADACEFLEMCGYSVQEMKNGEYTRYL